MFDKFAKRIVSLTAAVIMAVSNVPSVYSQEIITTDIKTETLISTGTTVCETEPATEVTTEETTEGITEEPATSYTEADLSHQSIEIHPDEENTDKSVILEGLMPEGAEAVAVDVSENYGGVAAYDITITNGEDEYQPGEENPILVEIADPVIPESDTIELWHIRDDDTFEQIFDFTVEAGKISFYATGFSVYEIVQAGEVYEPTAVYATTIEELVSTDGEGNPIPFVMGKEDNYLTNSLNSNSAFITVTSPSNASMWYFELLPTGSYGIYTYVNGQKMYVTNPSGNLAGLGTTPAEFEISKADDRRFFLKLKGVQKWFQFSNGGSGYRFYTDNNNTSNARLKMIFESSLEMPDDPYHLDNKTYGLMVYDSMLGYAMTATGKVVNNKDVLNDEYLFVRQDPVYQNSELYILDAPSDREITKWTFHNVSGEIYKISADNGMYLSITANGVKLTDEADASEITVTMGTGANAGKIKLSANGYELAETKKTGYGAGAASRGSWLSFVQNSVLTNDDFVIYSASKIGMSDKEDVVVVEDDVQTPEDETETVKKYVIRQDSESYNQVIVYTRVWNEDLKEYEFYAVDHQGNLVPCYERGNEIMWVGGQINTLLWDFVDYYYPDGVTHTNYYELINTYSGKVLAPRPDGSGISPKTVGINLNARNKDEYSGKIIAWDKDAYSYYALEADLEHDTVKSVLKKDARDEKSDFYFAVMNPYHSDPSTGELIPVPTIDNNMYGITIKMQDFANKKNNSPTNHNFQDQLLGDNEIWSAGTAYTAVKNLLSTNLESNGYPTAVNTNRSLSDLFNNPTTVNHLFLQSIYDESGYFEFDSCQNFATLKQQDGSYSTDFTVFKELATSNASDKPTLQHGQFLPFDNIGTGEFIADLENPRNPYNLYDAIGNELDESDPRKYEKLYNIEDPEYYYGMELQAGFVQTKDGTDAWGHDIIFEFTGDDDFWLYVDDQLVIDLGGIHSAMKGTVNFRTGEVETNGSNGVKTTLEQIFRENYNQQKHTDSEALAYLQETNNNPDLTMDDINADETLLAEFNDYKAIQHSQDETDAYINSLFQPKTIQVGNTTKTVYVFRDYSPHKMKIFYMERGAGAANLHMRFNLSYIKPGSVVLNKQVQGAGDIDYSLMKYPYQIEVLVQTGNTTTWNKLTPSDPDFEINYLNPFKPVDDFQPTYTVDSETYENVFFITPGKEVSVKFPDDTISYRITECGLNSEVYDTLICNGETVSGNPSATKKTKDFTTSADTVEHRPTMQLTNVVSPDASKTLTIEKKLVDKDRNEIQDDSSTFNFRLWLEDGSKQDKPLTLTNMHTYYVVDEYNRLCVWNTQSGGFQPTEQYYNDAFEELSEEEKLFYANETSPNGQISNIPAKYKVKVPGLLNGTKFMVEERESDNPIGYQVYKLAGYECMHDSSGDEPSNPTYEVESGTKQNAGTVIKDYSPHLRVTNQKGWGIEVTKEWSDADYTSEHDPVYVAVYVNGELQRDTVRKIGKISDTLTVSSQRYFFDELENGTTLGHTNPTDEESDYYYEVREVKITPDGSPLTVDETNGYVTLAETQNVVPLTEWTDQSGNQYTVEYYPGEPEGHSNDQNARKDTIRNVRNDGIAIRLFDWGNDTPLPGGTFQLTWQENENNAPVVVGKNHYTSDELGEVMVLYGAKKTGTYTLTQTAAPNGYVGLPEELIQFTVHSDGSGGLNVVITKDENGLDSSGGDNGNYWVDPSTADPTGVYQAVIDVHNRPFGLKAVKIDGETQEVMKGATFALYKGVKNQKGEIIKDYFPMAGYESLVSGADGVIPQITNVLLPGIYFLAELSVSEPYLVLDVPVEFSISNLGYVTILNASQCGCTLKGSPVSDPNANPASAAEEAFVITIPNVKKNNDFYFNIEKFAFLDKNVHGSTADSEQKFVFMVERFTDEDTAMNSPLETFYVTLNCEELCNDHLHPGILNNFADHSYSSGRVEIHYADSETYSFPTAIERGVRTVHVKQKGIYRVTEIKGWSSTDYDFWEGSNGCFGTTVGNIIAQGTNSKNAAGPYVAFRITDADSKNDDSLTTASFTNTETEYAYLSSQAYAENTISK